MDKNSDDLKSNNRLNLKNIANESGNYDGVGSDLKVARVRKGLNIKDVASSIRISSSYIEAIEQGKFDDLPGEAYIIGFIKAYSKFLGLDQYAILEQFKKESVRSNNLALEFPITRDRYNYPTKKIIFSSLILLIGAYFIYIYFDRDNKKTVRGIDSVPQRIINESEATITDNNKLSSGYVSSKQLNIDKRDEDLLVKNESSVLNSNNELSTEGSLETKYEETSIITDDNQIDESIGAGENTEAESNEGTGAGENTVAESNEGIGAGENAIAESNDAIDAIDDPVVLKQEEGLIDSEIVNKQVRDAEINGTLAQERSQNNVDIANSKTFILAKEDIWVHVETINGEIIYSGIILEGNRLNIPITNELVFSTGNGGAFKVLVNGKENSPIGEKG